MGSMSPVAFDIETSGFGDGAVVTVAGLYTDEWATLIFNNSARLVDVGELEQLLNQHTTADVDVRSVCPERELLKDLGQIVNERVDPDDDYITAYNGETWNGGFDLPFLRSACIRNGAVWPLESLAYIDVFGYIDRIDTNDTNGLVEVYDYLIGDDTCDPFDDSQRAVEAYEDGNFGSLLLHNLADIKRTYELDVVCSDYVPQADIDMKSLETPNAD
jgi:uncharacterized protein YprB with RNaseH-like and TPR domain